MLKVLTILLTFILLSSFQFAQERNILRPDGKIIKQSGDLKNLEVMSIKERGLTHNQTHSKVNSVLEGGAIDTLEYWSQFVAPLSNFGMFGQDWMLQWFKAPVGLNIRQVAFSCYENVDAMTVEVKLVKLNWTEEELADAGVTLWGDYPAAGNGFNDITAFSGNPDATGDWNAIEPGSTSPFGEDIWSDGGVGFPIVPVGDQGATHTYQWIDLSVIDLPALAAGEIFGIAIKHTGTGFNANRVGYWTDDLVNGFTAFKFYANGRTDGDLSTAGWWSREFTFDFVAEVEYTEDVAPSINSFTRLSGTADLGPFTVDANITDVNPVGTAGVASAYLHWTNDEGTTWDSVAMSGTEPEFTGDIPTQSPVTTVEYYISASDVNGNFTESSHWSFYIFAPTPGINTLLVFNGYGVVDGYPAEYYFGSAYWPNPDYTTVDFPHDVWAYGALPEAVVNSYTNILEICTSGPSDINSDVIRTWLEADATRNYMLAGDEWLGTQTGWVNTTYAAGTFQFDILGINADHNDVNYAVTGDQNLPSVVYPQTGSLLGGPTFDLYTQVSADSGWTGPMLYDPFYEIAVTNWLDGVDFEADVEVDMKGLAIDSITVYNIGGHRTLAAGNKIAFFAFDPLSLDYQADGYYWYGFTVVAPQVEFLKWIGVEVDVKEVGGNLPQGYAVSQNYPNPFNPTTTIDFSVPKSSFVTLKVYDILGKEIKTLINKEMNSGNFKINFDATGLASGMYVYTLTAGDFTSSKKMVLLK